MIASTFAASATAVAPGLTPDELLQGKAYLAQSQAAVAGAVKGLSSAQWTYQPNIESWSIAQIADHVIFVLERVGGPLRQGLAEAPAPPADRDAQLVDSIVIHQFPTRLRKFTAPEFAVPSGRFASAAESLRVLSAAYAALNDFLESTPDLREHVLEAMPLKAVTQGKHDLMDGYQWILAAAAHAERHAKQMLEVRADAGFPGY